MTKQPKERVPSPAKAAVARQKFRDDKGRFLSGAELEAYKAQQQQAQFAAERARLEGLFGRSMSPPMTSGQQQIPSNMVPNSFESIVQANKPRGMASDVSEEDKWNILLGRKKRGGLL